MLKQLSIYIVLTAFGSTSLNAQQQEAVLQRMEVPGAHFDIVLAMPKQPAAAIYDLSELPDALILHLTGGELALGFDDPIKMIAALELVRSPACTFHVDGKGSESPKPIAVFVVPKGE